MPAHTTNSLMEAAVFECSLVLTSFNVLQKSKENKSVATKKKSEDSKEQLLQVIRRHSAVSSVKEMSSKEQQQRIAEYDERMRGMMSDNSRDLLVNVQEQLLGLFSKLKVSFGRYNLLSIITDNNERN